MSSRRNRRSNPSSGGGVRGPNSALTEFLKEKGISAAEIAQRHQRNRAQAASNVSETGPGTNDIDEEEEEDGNEDEDEKEDVLQMSTCSNIQVVINNSPSGSGRRRSSRRQSSVRVNANDYEFIDEEEEEEEVEITPKRKPAGKNKATLKMTKAALAKEKAAQKSKLKRKRGVDDDDDGDGDFDFTPQVPQAGQIAFCETCSCRFTVTAYSKQGPDGEGLLCNACGKKNAATEKQEKKSRQVGRKNKKDKARALLDNEASGVPSLRDLCIKLVATHIDDVEALGDIGSVNMDRICQIISRNRSLNNETMQLFLDAGSQKLSFYDASKIQADQLKMVAAVVPTLRRLELNFCGHMTDDCLDHFSSQLKELDAIHLHGPFLVTNEAYVRFFKARGANLYEVSISDTARFGYEAFEALAQYCPNLQILRLKTLTYIEDKRLSLLSSLTNLKILEIIDPDGEISDAPIRDILFACGSGLLELNLDFCTEMEDETLKVIKQTCPRLQVLLLTDMDLISAEGIANLFTNWKINSGLSRLSLQRCLNLDSAGLVALVEHSANTLEFLDLNSCEQITEACWAYLETVRFPRLTELDISFIRSVNDQVVESLVKIAPELKVLKVWGNTFVTNYVKISEDVRLIGREADIIA